MKKIIEVLVISGVYFLLGLLTLVLLPELFLITGIAAMIMVGIFYLTDTRPSDSDTRNE